MLWLNPFSAYVWVRVYDLVSYITPAACRAYNTWNRIIIHCIWGMLSQRKHASVAWSEWQPLGVHVSAIELWGYRAPQICCGAIRRAVQSAVARVQVRHMQMGSDLRRTVDFMHCLNSDIWRYCDIVFTSSDVEL